MNSPQLQSGIAGQIFKACSDVVTVRFNFSGTDWQTMLFRGANGRVIRDSCGWCARKRLAALGLFPLPLSRRGTGQRGGQHLQTFEPFQRLLRLGEHGPALGSTGGHQRRPFRRFDPHPLDAVRNAFHGLVCQGSVAWARAGLITAFSNSVNA